MQEAITEEKQHERELVDSRQSAQQSRHTINQSVREQEQTYQDLKYKVDRWRERAKQQHNALAVEREKQRDVLREKQIQREKQQQENFFYEQVLQQSLELARKKLIKKYQNSDEGKQYIDDVVDRIARTQDG
jgi:F0F1-type ATP synthase membrane subunit b/b'